MTFFTLFILIIAHLQMNGPLEILMRGLRGNSPLNISPNKDRSELIGSLKPTELSSRNGSALVKSSTGTMGCGVSSSTIVETVELDLLKQQYLHGDIHALVCDSAFNLFDTLILNTI
jgi:hypothetical protein